MNWNATLDRITNNARGLTPGKVAVTIISAPFFIIGWLIGLVWVAGALIWSAGWVGVESARTAVRRPATDDGGG